MTTTMPTPAARRQRPAVSWRQVPRDLAYLLPGFPIAIASFVVLVVALVLGVGLIPLALLGLLILAATMAAARGFAAAERARVGAMEGTVVGPVYHRSIEGSGLRRALNFLRDPQTWREWLHGVLILGIRCATWSVAITWTAAAASVTYVLWAWSLPRDEGDQGLADLVFGWDTYAADVIVNTAIGLVALLTLPYGLRAMANIEAALAWGLLTNENDALRARAAELARSRQAVVQAEADTLRRVERDIHDGPQQRLVRLTMDLKAAQRRMAEDPDSATPLLDEALQQTQEALDELRALSRGIAPPILADRGLHAALSAAAGRCPVPVDLDVRIEGDARLPAAVESAAYFVVVEALTNVAKHSGASRTEISLVLVADRLYIQVTDDGIGGAHLGKGHGLAGLADRLAGVDGTLNISSPEGAGTVIDAEIPSVPR